MPERPDFPGFLGARGAAGEAQWHGAEPSSWSKRESSRVADRRRSGWHLGAGRRLRCPWPSPAGEAAVARNRRASHFSDAPLAPVGAGTRQRGGARRGVKGSLDSRRMQAPGSTTSHARASGHGDLRRGGGLPRRARRPPRRAPSRRHGLYRPRTRRPRTMGARGRLGTPTRRRGVRLLDRARVAAGDDRHHGFCASALDPPLARSGRAHRSARPRRAPPRAERLAPGPSGRHAQSGRARRSARRHLAGTEPAAARESQLGGRTAR